MASVDNAAAAAYLKQRFSRKPIENMSYEESPLLAMMPKAEDFGGTNTKLPLSYADIPARSRTFSVAQANKGDTGDVAFEITSTYDYALFSVMGQTILQSKGDVNSWLPSLGRNAESAARALTRNTAIALYRDTTGSIGTTTSTTGTTITLGNRADVQNFEVNMYIQFADSAGAALRDSGARVKVTGLNRLAATAQVTVDTNLNTISGITSGDLIIPQGDFGKGFSGLASWVTSSATPAALYGVTRTTDKERLAGLYYNATGAPVREGVVAALAQGGELGAVTDKLFFNHDVWRKLAISEQGKIEYCHPFPYSAATGKAAKAIMNHRGFVFQGPHGPVECYADRHCQSSTGWALKMDTWRLWSTGPVPQVLKLDGQSILRETNNDAYEGRWGLYAQVCCSAPGHNIQIGNLGA